MESDEKSEIMAVDQKHTDLDTVVIKLKIHSSEMNNLAVHKPLNAPQTSCTTKTQQTNVSCRSV